VRGSVRKPKGAATWTVVVDAGQDPVTGKRRQKFRRGFRTRNDAEDALGTMLREAQTGQYVEPSSEAVGRFLEDWLSAVRPKLKASTWSGYDQKLRSHVIPRLRALPLRDLDALGLNKLYAELLKDGRQNGDGGGLSPRSVMHVHKIVRRALGDAVRWGKLRANPAELAEPPRPAPVEMRVWSAEQLGAFLDAVAEDRLRACWVLAATTGMRRGELVGLRWDDVDLDASRLSVRRSRVAVRYEVVEGEPKSGRARMIDLDGATVAELRSHRKRQLEERLAWGEAYQDSRYLFTREDGTAIHPHSLSQFFEKRVARAGLPALPFHGLRHTHATLGLAAGVEAKVMQERLGHASIGITLDLYTHVVPGMQRDAAERIATLIPRSVINP
jgi:integrase